MHELAVCQSLLREVERVASAHGAAGVSRIEVAVGSLSGIEAALLDRAFSIARMGKACKTETRPASANALLCAQCGAWQVDVRSGDELVLRQVELVQPAEAATS